MFDGPSALSLPAGARRWWVLAVVAAELRAGPGEMDAVIAVYQAAYAALVITGGRMGDIYSRRPVFIVGVLAFIAASVWCGLAVSAPGLVLARLVQGMTAALMVPQVLAFVQVLLPGGGRSRSMVLSIGQQPSSIAL